MFKQSIVFAIVMVGVALAHNDHDSLGYQQGYSAPKAQPAYYDPSYVPQVRPQQRYEPVVMEQANYGVPQAQIPLNAHNSKPHGRLAKDLKVVAKDTKDTARLALKGAKTFLNLGGDVGTKVVRGQEAPTYQQNLDQWTRDRKLTSEQARKTLKNVGKVGTELKHSVKTLMNHPRVQQGTAGALIRKGSQVVADLKDRQSKNSFKSQYAQNGQPQHFNNGLPVPTKPAGAYYPQSTNAVYGSQGY